MFPGDAQPGWFGNHAPAVDRHDVGWKVVSPQGFEP
jgi:hypothetical protein